MSEDAANILIYRKGSIGDTIVSLPCFHRIAASFPHAKRFVLTNSPVSEKAAPLKLVLGGSGLIDDVIDHEPGIRSPDQLWQLSRKLRALRIHTAIYTTEVHSRIRVAREVAFLRFCGIKRIVGAPWRAAQLSYRQRPHDPDLLEHEADRLARWLAPLGPVDLQRQGAWDLRLRPQELSKASQVLAPLDGKPFIVLNVGGKAKSKDWGDKNWSELLHYISGLFKSAALVFIGSEAERERSEKLGQNWSNGTRVVNCCGLLTPRESAAVMGHAMMFVGHDSGPMHLAAAQSVRCVALFGSDNRPGIWYPYGEGHAVLHEVDGVHRISVERVADAITRVMATLPNMPRSSLGAS